VLKMSLSEFAFSDRAGTKARVIEKGRIRITRESLTANQQFTIYKDDGQIKITSNDFWFKFWRTILRKPKIVGIADIFTEDLEYRIELLEKVLSCNSTDELVYKINEFGILETVFLGTINGIYLRM